MLTKRNKRNVILGASMALAIISASSFITKAQANRLNYAAILYEHSRFKGKTLRIQPNRLYSDVGNSMNDEISSLEVANGCIVTVYIDSRFLGPKTTFYPGRHSYVGDFFNDEISSVKVICD